MRSPQLCAGFALAVATLPTLAGAHTQPAPPPPPRPTVVEVPVITVTADAPPPAPPAAPARTPSVAAPTVVAPVVLPPVPRIALQDPQVAAQASMTRARLQLLNAALPPLAQSSRSARITQGVVDIASGGIIGALSAFSFAGGGGAGETDIRPYLITVGAGQAANGIVSLAWPPARETLDAQYERMPTRTSAQRAARLAFGERALEEMVADGQRRRVLSTVTTMGVQGVALLVTYRDPIFNGRTFEPGLGDVLVFGLAAASVVIGVVQLFMPGEERRVRDAYWQQVHLLQDTAPVNGM